MYKIFFKTLIKNNILFRILLTFQLICIFCIYFISCYYWGEYTIENVININIQIVLILFAVGYLIFWVDYTRRNYNLFKIFYKYGAGKKKILLYYYVFNLLFFFIAYMGTVGILLLISGGWTISVNRILQFVIYELPVCFGIYSLAFGLGVGIFELIKVKEKKSGTFFKDNKSK